MKSKSFKMSNYFNLPNPGLKQYFNHVVSGSTDVIRTPFEKSKSAQEVLNAWESQLESIRSSWPSLWDFEIDLKSKVGPMSIMLPLSERLDDIDAYYNLIGLDQVPISKAALESVVKEWGGVRLTPRSLQKTVDLMKKSTNSGSPYFTKRRNVVSKTMLPAINSRNGITYQILNLPKDPKDYIATAILGWRGQEGGPENEDVKQRVIWMFPFGVNILELSVYQKVVEYAQSKLLVPAWVSMDAVDRHITKLFATKGNSDIVCTDFSKFDQHFNPACQEGAKFILSQILDKSSTSQSWLEDVFPIKYSIPLMINYGEIRTGAHGMASGSGGTNADETLLHRALQYEVAQSKNKVLNPYSMCLGDDGILSYPGINVKDVLDTYTKHGLEMNESKQHVSKTDCIYLRRWHHRDYKVGGVNVGVYSTFRALGRLMYQERFYDPEIWSKEMVCLRYLSIMENVKWHPLRIEFARFVMERDKYRLGLDIPGFLENIDRISQEATDLLPDFLGYTKSNQLDNQGLSSWWIVKYLLSQKR